MAIIDGVRIGGILTYWSLAELSHRDQLQEALKSHSLSRFLPEAALPATALRQAMQVVIGRSDLLIRPLQTRQGFAAVREVRGEASNEYSTLFSAALLGDKVDFRPVPEHADRILEQYSRHLGFLQHAAVSRCLVRIAAEHFSAVTPRTSGGFYWIPPYHVEAWDAIASAVEACGVGHRHSIFSIKHIMDGDAMRAVKDAIEREILQRTEKIREEILSGDLGEKAIENRVQEAKSLHEKVREYEAILGTGLEHLHLAADNAAVSVGAGTLMGS
jgi:hypothetical protein